MREKATDLFAERKLEQVIYFDGIAGQVREHRNGVSYAAGTYAMGNTMTELRWTPLSRQHPTQNKI